MQPPSSKTPKELVDDLTTLSTRWAAVDAFTSEQLQQLGQWLAVRSPAILEGDILRFYDLPRMEAIAIVRFSRCTSILIGLHSARIAVAFGLVLSLALNQLTLWGIIFLALLVMVTVILQGLRFWDGLQAKQRAVELCNLTMRALQSVASSIRQDQAHLQMQKEQQFQTMVQMLAGGQNIQQQSYRNSQVTPELLATAPETFTTAARQLTSVLERLESIENRLSVTMHLSAQISDDYHQRDEQVRHFTKELQQIVAETQRIVEQSGSANQKTQELLKHTTEESERLVDMWEHQRQIWQEQVESAAAQTADDIRAQSIEISRTGETVREGLQRLARAYTEVLAIVSLDLYDRRLESLRQHPDKQSLAILKERVKQLKVYVENTVFDEEFVILIQEITTLENA